MERAEVNDEARQQAQAVEELDEADNSVGSTGSENMKFAKRSVLLLCSFFWLSATASSILRLMEMTSSPSSKKIFTLVSSGVPSARVLRMTKLTQKWLRWYIFEFMMKRLIFGFC